MEDNILFKLREVQIELLDEFTRFCDEHNLSYFFTSGTLIGAVRHKGFIPWDDDVDIAMHRKDYELFLDLYNANEKYYVVSYRSQNRASDYCQHFTRLCKSGTLFAEKNKDEAAYTGIFIDIWPIDTSVLFFAPLQYKITKTFCQFCRVKAGINSYNKMWKYNLVKFICFFLNKKLVYFIHRKLYTIFNNKKTKTLIFLCGLYGYKREIHSYDSVYPLGNILFENKYYKSPNNFDEFLKVKYGDYMELPPVEKRRTHSPVEINFNLKDNLNP